MVYTAGYGNRPIEDFISLIERFGIASLYDIRTYPRSRWQPAYNMARLSEALEARGIAYSHRKNLGGKDTGTLDLQARASDLREIAAAGKVGNVVIICAESDFRDCHRKDVAMELVALDTEVTHIGKDGLPVPVTPPPEQLALGSPEVAIQDWREKAAKVLDGLDVSEGTRKEYKQRIGLFFDFSGESPVGRDVFLEYKRYLASRTDYGASTKNKYLIVARVFLKELHRLGLLPVDVTQTTRSFSHGRLHKREGLSASEVRELSAVLSGLPQTLPNLRLKALFCLLAMQGLRQIEVVRLDVADIDLARKVALVRGKGKDDKEPVHLHPETVRHLRAYMRAAKASDGAVFRSLGNRGSDRLTTMTVMREMKRLMEGVCSSKTVHGFRHYYVTALLEKFDVRDVRKFSRHRSLEMLIVYDDEVDTSRKAAEAFKCFDGLFLGD